MNQELTIAEEVKKFLSDRGMFPNQVEDVFKLASEYYAHNEMVGRWNDKPSDYGQAPIMNIILANVKDIALKYIDETCPEAWFRIAFLTLKDQIAFVGNGNGGNILEKELQEEVLNIIDKIDYDIAEDLISPKCVLNKLINIETWNYVKEEAANNLKLNKPTHILYGYWKNIVAGIVPIEYKLVCKDL